MVNVRSKGQRGEREAASLIMAWAEEVTEYLGTAGVELKRNLMQSRQGGYDLVGLDWLALEVKRHESLAQISQWWKQAVAQAGPGQVPFLMYRQNRSPWRFRVELTCLHAGPCGNGSQKLVVDLSEKEACNWFKGELYWRLVT